MWCIIDTHQPCSNFRVLHSFISSIYILLRIWCFFVKYHKKRKSNVFAPKPCLNKSISSTLFKRRAAINTIHTQRDFVLRTYVWRWTTYVEIAWCHTGDIHSVRYAVLTTRFIFHRRVRYCSFLFVSVRHCLLLFRTVPNCYFFLSFNAILHLLKNY